MIDLINNEIASFIDSIESVDEDSLNKIRNRYASSITEDLKNGHYTSNICMVLASNLKLNPKELSTTLVEKLNNLNIFEKVESDDEMKNLKGINVRARLKDDSRIVGSSLIKKDSMEVTT